MLLRIFTLLLLSIIALTGYSAENIEYGHIGTGIEGKNAEGKNAINDSRVLVGGNEIYLGNRMALPDDFSVNDINNNGDIVGSYQRTGEIRTHAFRFSSLPNDIDPEDKDAFKDLGALLDGSSSTANAVNKFGAVVGVHNINNEPRAFHFTTEMRDIGPFVNNSYNAVANDINDQSQIVGKYKGLDGEYHAFLWEKDKNPNYFGELNSINSINSSAVAINNKGVVIGNFKASDNSDQSFYYDAAARQLSYILLPDGFTRSTVIDINDSGIIVGKMIGPSVWAVFLFDTTIANSTAIEVYSKITSALPLLVFADAKSINNNGDIVIEVWTGSWPFGRIRLIILSPIKNRPVAVAEHGKLITDLPIAGGELGIDVAASGAYMASTSTVNQKPLITIFKKINTVWKFDQVLNLADHGYNPRGSISGLPINIDIFDNGVDGATLVVGAPLDSIVETSSNTEITSSGSIFLFTRGADGWVVDPKITATIPVSDGRFGYNVAIDKNALVIAEKVINETSQTLEGAVSTYYKSTTDWINNPIIAAPAGKPFFGSALDVDNNRLIISAISNNYVYVKQGNDWVFDTELIPSGNTTTIDADVSIVGDTIAILSKSNSSGTIYIFKLTSTGLVLGYVQRIGGAIDSMSLGPNQLVVNRPTGTSIYLYNNFFFKYEQTLFTDAGFVSSSDIGANQLVIGSNLYSPFSTARYAGAAYIYSFCEKTCDDTTSADIAVTITAITAPRDIRVLDTVEYSITITNNSTQNAATSIKIANLLPYDTQFIAADPSSACIEHRTRELRCSIDRIEAGATASLTITHSTPNSEGEIENTIEITSFGPDSNLLNNTDFVKVNVNPAGEPNITISKPTKQQQLKISVGEPITLEFQIDRWLSSSNSFQLFLGNTYQDSIEIGSYSTNNNIELTNLTTGSYVATIKLVNAQGILTDQEQSVSFDVETLDPNIYIAYLTSEPTVNRIRGMPSYLKIGVNNWYKSAQYSSLYWVNTNGEAEMLSEDNRINLSSFEDGEYTFRIYIADSTGETTDVETTIKFQIKTRVPKVLITQPLSSFIYSLKSEESLLVAVSVLHWNSDENYRVTLNGDEVSGDTIPANLLNASDASDNVLEITLLNADNTVTQYSESVTFSVKKDDLNVSSAGVPDENTSHTPNGNKQTHIQPASLLSTNTALSEIASNSGGGLIHPWTILIVMLIGLIRYPRSKFKLAVNKVHCSVSTWREKCRRAKWKFYKLLFIGFSSILILNCNSNNAGNDKSSTLLKGIPTSGQYSDFVIDQNGQRLYVSDVNINQIHIFDTNNDAYIQSVNIENSPTRLTISDNNGEISNTLFVIKNGGTEISALDLLKLTQKSISIQNGTANSLVVDNENKRLYVGVGGDTNQQSIRVFDSESLESLIEPPRLNTGGLPQGHVLGFNSQTSLLLTAEYNKSAPTIIAWDVSKPGEPVETERNHFFGSGNSLLLTGRIKFTNNINKNDNTDLNKMYFVADGSVSYTGHLQSYRLGSGDSFTSNVKTNVEYRPIALAFNSKGDRMIVAHDSFLQTKIVLDSPRHSREINDIHIFDTQTNELLLVEPLTKFGIDSDFRIKSHGILWGNNGAVYLLLTDGSVDSIAVLHFDQ